MNWVDVFMVSLWIASVSGSHALADSQFLRMLRLVKLLRMVRLVRAVQAFDALYVICTAIQKSIPSLAWTISMFVAITSFFALFLCQVLLDYYIHDETMPLEGRQKVFRYFGTFTRSIFSMFEITFGNWVVTARILADHVSEWFMLLAMLYKISIGFAVVGVINGVFMQETFKVASMDDSIAMRQKARENKTHLEKMKRLFAVADAGGDDKIWPSELAGILDDPAVRAWFAAQGLPIADGDANRLFTLLDKNGDGYVSKAELLAEVGALRGNARSIDVRILMHEIALIKTNILAANVPVVAKKTATGKKTLTL
jgi:hypothetical protein